jgi:hypothetical protein
MHQFVLNDLFFKVHSFKINFKLLNGNENGLSEYKVTILNFAELKF